MLKVALLIIFAFIQTATAQESSPIQLPAADMAGGKPLMQALKERKTGREFSDTPLPEQILSNLLWAASGINRPDSGKRTAPTAKNMQEIDIYVALEKGLYLYKPAHNILEPVMPRDIRAATGKQDFVSVAPVNLIFVADLSRMDAAGEQAEFYAACDTGFMSQNVYLYCASEGLTTVVRGWFDAEELAQAMNLRTDQKIILTQTVGYPK